VFHVGNLMATFLNWKCILLLALCIITLQVCFAHGDLSKRINAVSQIITQYPDSASLYHSRGVLYTQHGDFLLAQIDLAYCRRLNYKHITLPLDIATVWFHLKAYSKALNEIEEIICEQAKNFAAFRLKGSVLFQQKKFTEAAQCFEKAIGCNPQPIPENYIEASGAWQLSNEVDANCKTLEILEKGKTALGNLYVLKKEIIKLHLANDDLEDAITEQSKLVETLNRKEHAYYDLALMKINANLHESAINDLQLAKAAIEQLPIRLKTTEATENLNRKINNLLHKS